MAVSSWGSDWGTMSWLDQDTGCKGECTNSPTVTIKNLAYNSGKGPGPGPGPGPSPPSPKDFDFGAECATSKDQDCSLVECADHHCKWSWPHNDPAKWDSKDAKCRCDQTKSTSDDGPSDFI